MVVALIAAVAANGVIGRDNRLPWHLPEDLREFKRITLGKPIIMGRKTFESIGRPLPGRTSIVLTRRPDWTREGVVVAANLRQALAMAEELAGGDQGEIMVIGGEQIYRLALPLADRLYLTRVDLEVPGDSHFPALDPAQWREVSRRVGHSDTGGVDYAFLVLERVRG